MLAIRVKLLHVPDLGNGKEFKDQFFYFDPFR